jgi:hypothetical protein
MKRREIARSKERRRPRHHFNDTSPAGKSMLSLGRNRRYRRVVRGPRTVTRVIAPRQINLKQPQCSRTRDLTAVQ